LFACTIENTSMVDVELLMWLHAVWMWAGLPTFQGYMLSQSLGSKHGFAVAAFRLALLANSCRFGVEPCLAFRPDCDARRDICSPRIPSASRLTRRGSCVHRSAGKTVGPTEQQQKTKFRRGLSPQANYTDRATAACLRT
jgi:hypothetical protein